MNPGPPEGSWQSVSLAFIARPDWEPASDRRAMVRNLAGLWLIGLAGAWAAFVLLNAIATPAGFENNLEDALDDLENYEQLILVVMFAPLVEEAIYRLPLARRLQLPLLALSGVVTAFFFLSYWILGLIVAAVALLVWAVTPWREAAEAWWATHAQWPIWISAALFALSHLINFDVDWSFVAVLAIPFAVGPQLWLGLMFTIARVRYGWWAAVAVHALHNLTVWSIATAVG